MGEAQGSTTDGASPHLHPRSVPEGRLTACGSRGPGSDGLGTLAGGSRDGALLMSSRLRPRESRERMGRKDCTPRCASLCHLRPVALGEALSLRAVSPSPAGSVWVM